MAKIWLGGNVDPMRLPGHDRGQLANGEQLKDVVRLVRSLLMLRRGCEGCKRKTRCYRRKMIEESLAYINVKYEMGVEQC